MNIEQAFNYLYPPCKAMFPDSTLVSPGGTAMMLAIGMQESHFTHRQQLIGANQWWRSTRLIAASFYGFEDHAVQRILDHRVVGPMARRLCTMLDYPPDAKIIHPRLVDADLLATGFARLLLYTYPRALPREDDPEEGWRQYIWCWRPGKPRPAEWDNNFKTAWEVTRAHLLN